MKNFLVNIRAYGYHARFQIVCEDDPIAIENSIVDKIGEKGVKWGKRRIYQFFKKMDNL
jgi:hypothetical protein